MKCPKKGCNSYNIKKNGFSYARHKKTQKYVCKDCGKFFLKEVTYGRKDFLQKEIESLRKQGLSIRAIAKTLGCSKRTVDKRLQNKIL